MSEYESVREMANFRAVYPEAGRGQQNSRRKRGDIGV